MSDTTATTTPLAVWAGVGAAALGTKAYFEAPWWIWVGVLSWLVLTVVAILGQSEGESRKFLSGTLRKSTYTQIYTGLVGRSHDRLWSAYCDPVDRGAGLPAMFRAALTWRLYDRALLLAVIYPILLPVLWWLVTGQAAQLGPVVFLEATGFWDVWPERVAVLGAFVVLILGKLAAKSASNSPRRFWRSVSSGLYPVAVGASGSIAAIGAVTAAVALAVAGALAFAFAFVGTGAVALAVALALAIPFIYGSAVALAVTCTAVFAAAVMFLDSRGRPVPAKLMVIFGALLLWMLAATTVPWGKADIGLRTLFLFLGVLPLINALFDVISYAVTLSFIRRGRESRLPVLYGLADLGVALLLFVALGVTMVAVIAGLNGLAGTDILDLGALLRDLRDQPGSYWWLYGIAFSTILPTALHAALALLGVQGLWPKPLRRVVAGWIGNAADNQIDATRGAFALGLLWAVPVWVIVAAGWAAWHWGGTLGTSLAGQYLTVLERVAEALGAG